MMIPFASKLGHSLVAMMKKTDTQGSQQSMTENQAISPWSKVKCQHAMVDSLFHGQVTQ